ncbi:hypothetical protein FS320_18900, partial [Microvirga tunisiensis]|nr:hypothetical protein [Microvirga tunisiensis]MPR27218.1 hypothetical protein [Microvirga tunisiensis]
MVSRLFEPIQIGNLHLDNRIAIAPMCQYSAEGGLPNDWHLIHLGQLALSGAGLLILEATAVSPQGRISPYDLGLYSDETEEAFARLLKGVRLPSAIPLALQLAHAGRKASSRAPWEGGAQIRPDEPLGWETEAPSAIPHAEGESVPTALDRDGLKRVRDDFVNAARDLCWILGDGADQATLCVGVVAISVPSWNLTPAITFGNWFSPI